MLCIRNYIIAHEHDTKPANLALLLKLTISHKCDDFNRGNTMVHI